MKCTKCQYHQVINDRDPHDWFCDDDAAIVCTKIEEYTSDNEFYISF